MAEPNLCCVCFDLIFEEEDLEFDLDFEEVQIIHTDYDPYMGPYEVIPKAWEDTWHSYVTTAQSKEKDGIYDANTRESRVFLLDSAAYPDTTTRRTKLQNAE